MREEVSAKWGNELDNNPNIDMHYTRITDFSRQKDIILHPEQKTFLVPQYALPHDTKSDSASRLDVLTSGSRFKRGPAPDALASLYKLLQVPDESTQKLPEKTVDGKKCVGFYVEKTTNTPFGKNIRKWTYWVDTSTKQPVRIEQHWTGTFTGPRTTADGKVETVAAGHGETEWIISEIVFDAPLDPKLFSTDPPEGWTDLAKKNSVDARNNAGHSPSDDVWPAWRF